MTDKAAIRERCARIVERAAYLRGLEDAARLAEDWSRFHGFEAAGSRIVELIRALAKEDGE